MRHDTTEQVHETDVREALAMVLASDEFARSKQIQKLLENIVEKTLCDKADELKAYSIGLDVFNREPDFDPEKDAIVRVEMGRLRKKLKYYYLSDGKDDPLQIVVPKGTYRPSFTPPQQRQPLAIILGLSKSMGLSNTVMFLTMTGIVFFVILLVDVLLVTYLHEKSHRDPAVKESVGQGLPIVHISPFKSQTANGIIELAGELKAHLLTNLIQYKTLKVHDVRYLLSTRYSSKPIGQANLYQIDGTLHKSSNTFNLNISVTDISDRSLLWSKRIIVHDASKDIRQKLFEFIDLTAIKLADFSGVIWADSLQHLRKKISLHGSENLSSEECVMLFHGYDQNKEKTQESIVRKCLNRFIAARTSNGSVWAGWAMLRFLDWTKNPDGVDLALALSAARKAVSLDPANATSHEYLGSILMAAGEKREALSQYNKAIELNPLKPDLHVLVGWQEVLNGKWAGGIKKIRKGVNAHISPPGWMRIPLSIDAFKRNDYKNALFQAETIIQSGDSRGIILALAAATALGDQRMKTKYRQVYLAYDKATPAAPLNEIRGVFNVPLVLDSYAKTLEKADLAPAM